MIEFWLIGLFSVCLSCISQVLLKKAAMHHWPSHIKEYVNIFVIAGYGIMAVCVFLTIYMYTGLDLKYGAVIESAGYIIILILSRLIFDEEITAKKAVGNLLIVMGIIVFNFGAI